MQHPCNFNKVVRAFSEEISTTFFTQKLSQKKLGDLALNKNPIDRKLDSSMDKADVSHYELRYIKRDVLSVSDYGDGLH